ncbi:MAG: hypothetical protein R2774_05475 [Saprospiraceae bacterium]
MKLHIYFFTTLLLFGLIACNEEVEDVDSSTFGYEYYPVSQGAERIFTSDSIIVRLGGPRRDTLRSYIKEVIGDSYIDAEGKEVKRVFRFWKRNLDHDWTPINTWTMFNDSNYVIRNEENISLLSLVFPLKLGTQWNPTVFIDPSLQVDAGGDIMKLYEGWEAEVVSDDATFDLNGTLYPMLEISMANSETVIDIRKVEDFYVKNIGLVKRNMIMYDCNGNNLQSPWSIKANQGFEHILTLISYQP